MAVAIIIHEVSPALNMTYPSFTFVYYFAIFLSKYALLLFKYIPLTSYRHIFSTFIKTPKKRDRLKSQTQLKEKSIRIHDYRIFRSVKQGFSSVQTFLTVHHMHLK